MTAPIRAARAGGRTIGAREDLLPRWAGWLLALVILAFSVSERALSLSDPQALLVVAASLAAAVLSTWVTKAAVPMTLLYAFGTTAWPSVGVGFEYLVVLWMPFVVGARYGLVRAAGFLAAVLAAESVGSVLAQGGLSLDYVGILIVELLVLAGSALGGVFVGRVWQRGSRVESDLRESNDAFRRALSRDLHDTAVHATTTMVMRANQVLLREDLDPQVRRDVQFIVDTGQEATATLRATLASLREADPATAATSADATWFRAQVAGAVTRLEEASFRVRASTEVSLVDVPPPILSTLGRILTEVANNVIRHGLPGSEVTLMVENTGETLDLMCSNPRGPGAVEEGDEEAAGVDRAAGADGPGEFTDGTGAAGSAATKRRSWGLLGVRELAEAVGGSSSFHPLGEYWVASVSLPLHDAAGTSR